MVNVLKKWVESDKREIKRLSKIADKVEAYADKMAALSDEDLKAKTPEFKNAIRLVKRWKIYCPKLLQLFVKEQNEFWVCIRFGCKFMVVSFCMKVILPK